MTITKDVADKLLQLIELNHKEDTPKQGNALMFEIFKTTAPIQVGHNLFIDADSGEIYVIAHLRYREEEEGKLRNCSHRINLGTIESAEQRRDNHGLLRLNLTLEDFNIISLEVDE